MSEYVFTAMSRARYIPLEDGSYYADVFLCPGVWAIGETVEECRDVLMETLFEWLFAAYEGEEPLPEMTELAWLNPLWHTAGD